MMQHNQHALSCHITACITGSSFNVSSKLASLCCEMALQSLQDAETHQMLIQHQLNGLLSF
jgi:hypothetical protein